MRTKHREKDGYQKGGDAADADCRAKIASRTFGRRPIALSGGKRDELDRAYDQLAVAHARDNSKAVGRAHEKIEFLERLHDDRELLIMALSPPQGPIFSDNFSNSTPWDMSEEPKGRKSKQ
ncbi:MAG: hypothetical protein V1492_04715 [Candidatus Micrarchaeota archaeon]